MSKAKESNENNVVKMEKMEMENVSQKHSVKEVLIGTIEILKSVGSIPLGMNEKYGVPVERSIANLYACVAAMNKAEQEGKDETDAK